MTAATSAAGVAGVVHRLVVGGVITGSDAGRHDLGLQRLELQRIDKTGLGIAARRLPARDHGAGLLIELARDLGVEAETVEAALHVAALALVEAKLVFRGLVGLLGEGGGIDTGGQVTGCGRGAILQRRDAGQRQRLEGPVRIVGEISVEFFRLVGILDRSPELKLDFGGLTGGDERRIRRHGRRVGSGNRIEIHRADQVGVPPGQLVLVGLFIDLGTNLGHRLLDLGAGCCDIGHQRTGEGAVGAGLAIERGLSGAGGERDQRAFTGFHFGEARFHRNAAGSLGGADPCRERIVAAGVEKHQFDLGVRHGLLQRDVDIDGGAELDVHLRFEVGIDRQQIIGAVNGDAVAGVIEQRDVGAFGLLAKLEQPLGHLVAGEV